MKKKKELKSEEIEIKSIAHKGLALGKTDEGMVVLTKSAIPGDRVEVRLHKNAKVCGWVYSQKLCEIHPIKWIQYVPILLFVEVAVGKI